MLILLMMMMMMITYHDMYTCYLINSILHKHIFKYIIYFSLKIQQIELIR